MRELHAPRFRVGESLRTTHYQSPLARGATVEVVAVKEYRQGYRYLVEGAWRGERVQIWMREIDLDGAFR
jgi:hypothetical protein